MSVEINLDGTESILMHVPGGKDNRLAVVVEHRNESRDEITDKGSETAEIAIGDSHRVREEFRTAHRAVPEARKGLAEAFKQRQRQDQEAYREAERRYQLCEEAIDLAIKAREKAEPHALHAYTVDLDQALHKASQVHKDWMKRARIECKQRVMDV